MYDYDYGYDIDSNVCVKWFITWWRNGFLGHLYAVYGSWDGSKWWCGRNQSFGWIVCSSVFYDTIKNISNKYVVCSVCRPICKMALQNGSFCICFSMRCDRWIYGRNKFQLVEVGKCIHSDDSNKMKISR